MDEIKSALRKNKCFGEIKQPRVDRVPNSSKVTFSLDFAYACSGELPEGA